MADDRTRTRDGHISAWFGALLLETAEACGIKVSETRCRVYAADLADLTRQQVETAVRTCRREGSGFFPSVAEIRRQVIAPPDDRALLAWFGLEAAVSKVGRHQSLVCDDPCAADALVSVFGSWPGFCDLEDGPALALKRQEFMAAYRAARRRLAAPTALAHNPVRLPGLAEASGNYGAAPRLAAGRLALSGHVEATTESALPEGAQKQLTTGEPNGEAGQ